MPRLRWRRHLEPAGDATTMTDTVSARTADLSWAPERVAVGPFLREKGAITNWPRARMLGNTSAGWKASPHRLILSLSRSGTKTTARSSILNGGVRPAGPYPYCGLTPNTLSYFAPYVTDGCMISFQKSRIGTSGTGASFTRSSSGPFGTPLDPSSAVPPCAFTPTPLSGFIFRQTTGRLPQTLTPHQRTWALTIATFRFQETSGFLFGLRSSGQPRTDGRVEILKSPARNENQGRRNNGWPSPSACSPSTRKDETRFCENRRGSHNDYSPF